MTVIEIEDYHGNTIMAFKTMMKIKANQINKFDKCEIADEDNDYIFKTKENLIRIQSTEE